MAKYDNQIAELKNLLPNAKNILIAVSAGANIDKLASGLALYLSLSAEQKQVNIVCDDTIKVAESHLFGIDKVLNTFRRDGGDFILTLEGVAVPDQTSETGWKVPALSTMDYVAENNNLNLIFHCLPGQTFQPTGVVPHYQGSGFNLIFTVGAPDLNSLGRVYTENQGSFSGVTIVNIDNSGSNTGFGASNVVDQNAVSVSEMLVDLIPSLGLPFDGDTASNLMAGIFAATSNLTSGNLNADTFMAVANCLRAGGKKSVANEIPAGQGLDLSGFPTPTVIPNPVAPETPRGEIVTPGTEIETEPDWLTPKIFKAGQG